MYKDIITYKLANGITQEHLLETAQTVIDNWMSKLSGFVSWEIHTNDNGSFTDVVCWDSKEAAKKAESQMMSIPNAIDWFACYEVGSIKSQGLTKVSSF